ncbi:MAG: TldD/PmbA family protein [Candidatus Odinarchaeota archaeon]
MQDQLEKIVDKCQQKGAVHADARYVKDIYQNFEVKNGSVSRVSESMKTGIGIRVLMDGAWGFSSTNSLVPDAMDKAIKKALKLARASRKTIKRGKMLSEEKTHQIKYETPVKIAPLEIEAGEIFQPLVEATRILQEQDPRIKMANGNYLSRSYYTHLITSGGSNIRQHLIQCGVSLNGMLMAGPRGIHSRTSEDYRAQGFEFIELFNLPEQAELVGKDLKILADKAESAPSGIFDLILEPSHLGLVIHESIGHPTELDRVLGREADFAGTSFVNPNFLGKNFKYGSELVNIVQDSTKPPALGSYGFDDEGIASHRMFIVEEGIFRNFQCDRTTAAEIGIEHSSGNARAHGYDRIPIDRMANLYFEPDPKKAHSSLDELISETKSGIFAMYSRTHSINEIRSNFQFTTQMGYKVENGELSTPLKNVIYGSRTLDFWRNCDATTKDVQIFGTPNCGKGNPGQTIWTSHGGGYSRFTNIRLGA